LQPRCLLKLFILSLPLLDASDVLAALAGVREWRGCGREAFIDRRKLLLLL